MAGSQSQTVVLCGNSLLLSGIETCLVGQAGFDVQRVAAALLSDAPGLDALTPDVLIFDLDVGNKLALDLIKQRPTMLLVGLDLDSHQVIVLSSRQRPITGVDDLVALIQQSKKSGNG